MKDDLINLGNSNIDLDSIQIEMDSNFDDKLDEINNTAFGANAAMAGYQTVSLQEAMNNYAKAMNEAAFTSKGQITKQNSSSHKGFAFEEHHKWTTKINALAKGIPDYKIGVYTKGELPDGTTLTGIDEHIDLVSYTRESPWQKPKQKDAAQLKCHNNPEDYAKDFKKGGKYDKPNLQNVGGAEQGVPDRFKTSIGGTTVESDPMTPQEAYQLSQDMKAQKTPEYAKRAEKQAELNRVKLGQAVKMGAATGAILTTVKEIMHVVKDRDNLSEDQWITSIQHILCGAAEGGIRGGTIAVSVQLLGKALGKEIAENSFGAVPAMALANASIDFAKDLYKLFVAKTIDADDLLCNTVNNTFSSVAGFTGAYIGGKIGLAGAVSIEAMPVVSSYLSMKGAAEAGAAIGSALGPIGTVIGATVGGLIIGYGASLIIGTANKDAAKAFNDCIVEIKTHTELSGQEQMYYFADAMSELSDFRLSFKNLLPCYNLISDLKEYNLRKKAIKNVRAQLESNLVAMDDKKRAALEEIEQQHRQRLAMLDSIFEDQRTSMYEQMGNSMKTYVENSYAQYVDTFNLCQFDIASLDFEREQALESHNAILASIEHRNEANRQLNIELDELMSDPESASKVKPFVDRIVSVMSQDKLITEKQYISFDEALKLQEGAV